MIGAPAGAPECIKMFRPGPSNTSNAKVRAGTTWHPRNVLRGMNRRSKDRAPWLLVLINMKQNRIKRIYPSSVQRWEVVDGGKNGTANIGRGQEVANLNRGRIRVVKQVVVGAWPGLAVYTIQRRHRFGEQRPTSHHVRALQAIREAVNLVNRTCYVMYLLLGLLKRRSQIQTDNQIY